jgi:hypothetical protein
MALAHGLSSVFRVGKIDDPGSAAAIQFYIFVRWENRPLKKKYTEAG